MSAAPIELRTAMIAAMKASAALQALMGADPRVMNSVPPEGDPRAVFPFIEITNPTMPWDTTTDRGHEHRVELRLMGAFEGDEEGEAIFAVIEALFRDWAPQTFSAHRLVNLVCQGGDVRKDEDGKRYLGLQRWRAVTEEI